MTPQVAVQAPPVPAEVPIAQVAPVAPQAPVATAPVAPPANVSRAILEGRRSELSRQLRSAESRRTDLLQELRRAPSDAVRAGIESRVALLDNRLLELERDIALNGRALAANPAEERETFTGVSAERGGFGGGRLDGPPLMAIVSLILLAPLVLAIVRRVWRGAPHVVAQRNPESDARLERIEQAVDAIAIEIERISEAQRFQNKLLGEGQGIAAFGFARQREGERVGG